MSSSRRPRTLRAKLVAGQVFLLAVLIALIGTVVLVALHETALRQLDGRVASHLGPPNIMRIEPGLVRVDHLRDGSLQAGKAKAADVGFDPLTDAQIEALLSVPNTGPRGHTIALPDLGDYRVLSDGRSVVALPLDSVTDLLWQMGLLLVALGAAAVCAAALVGRVIIRRTLKPLDDMAATATRVSELPLHEGEVTVPERIEDADPDTEVGKVGLALNRMLGHVESALNSRHASEMRVRQFVADASHELRTPLAAIRGYAELTRRTKEDIPHDIKHAMGRVESEATRMTSLVEDLLLLARIDAGRPLEDKDVDLTRLVIDVVGDARIAGRDHNWKLDLPEEPVTIRGDVQRLHQVIGNLLSNARTHTPPGTTVVTGLSVHNGHVDLTVTDDGPGIPKDLEVFERFARGDSSRSRAAGSTGLGLSIVTAVVSAHGGQVRVDSEPGRTRFTVQLSTSA
ncbi:two-component sensor histidine kinase [Lentzea sp. NBRC 105346]|uniref:sensor histidine kinase n=1 Tax=Lentzea sp. NBRC 105346 TaxID=3032205 RepID=UPI0024A2A66C|nr:HAMP domain-containing sensor histidine kinase [Lentzea sp. NBRC 105346]GLZ33322.1 two-component sensor histidine kinase [Lentzea sp. NBRC 105346]